MTTLAAELEAKPQGKPRYTCIDRRQTFLAPVDVKALIPPGHLARAVWELTGQLDFSAWEEGIEAREGGAGAALLSAAFTGGDVAVWIRHWGGIGEGSAREGQ